MGDETILIVDDDIDVQRKLSLTLRKQGYIPKSVSAGPLAIKIIELELIDMVILDINMPGLVGIDILKEMHIIKPNLPIIATSAFPTEEIMIESLEEGAYSFMRKPINTNYLKELIEEVLVKKR
jgi:DNA-binding NtrC family response regulator